MTSYSLKDKVAVVTGAAQCIGLAIAEVFLQKGAKSVIILDIKEEGSNTADSLNKKYGADKAVYYKCDVTKDLDIISERIFERNNVDILVNNAGIANDNLLRKTMEINAIAMMEWSLKFQEHMKKNGGGTIINISSNYGFLIDPFFPVYKASKFAIMGFSKTLGHIKNFNKTGVRVIVLCPGFTETRLNEGNIVLDEDTQKEWDAMIKDAIFQKPEAVGRAAAEVFERAATGTAWLIHEDKPIVEVP